MRTLYEINEEYLRTINESFSVDEETGEILFDENKLNELNEEFEDKTDAIACYIKDLSSMREAIVNEERNLHDRQKKLESKIDSLKEYIVKSMEMREKKSLETPRNRLSLRKSTSVKVVDENLIPKQFFTVKTSEVLNKKAVMDELKQGKLVIGAVLSEKQNLQIK